MSKSLSRLAVGVTLLLQLFTFNGNAEAEIRLGILPRLGAVELFMMFKPLAGYLTEAAGEKVSIVIPRDFDAFKEGVRSGNMDIGFANPLIYVQLRKEMALSPLVVAAEQKGGTRFRGVIIVRTDSGIKTIRDLRGKKCIFADRDSAAGYLFPVMLLKKSGIDFRTDITILPFAKKHDNVVLAVLNRAADAGGMREDDLEKMKSRVDLSKIKVVGYTDFFPNWPLFAAPKSAKGTVLKIQEALIELKPNDPAAGKILAAARIAGFAPIADRDYDKLRQAAQPVGAF